MGGQEEAGGLTVQKAEENRRGEGSSQGGAGLYGLREAWTEVALWGLGQVAEMGLSADEVKQEFQATVEEVLGRLRSQQLFQSEWDIAAFVVFLTFVGECGS